jgi:hypothetical protein
MLNNEIWKPIKDYESLYDISTFGRVKSLKWGKEKILNPKKDKKGYFNVCLFKGCKRKYSHHKGWKVKT